MFRVFGCCRKNVVHVEADECRNTHSSLSRVNISLTSATTVNSDGKISIWNRLFGRPTNYQRDKKRVTGLVDKTSEPKEKKKKPFRWWRKRNRVTPAPEEPLPKKLCPPAPHKHTVVKVTGGKGPEFQRVLLPVTEKEEGPTCSVPEPLAHPQRKCLGLPNPAQICYMNSCLQSLLTLEDFIKSISCQEPVWSTTPNAAVMSSLMDISRSHFSSDAQHKIRLLIQFKSAVAALNPEFNDLDQKDVHEFFTSVLHQMRSLDAQLRMTAASMGRTYSCPVEDHMLFKMRNIRTCKRCGEGSTREEEYTCLSLDLIRGKGTIEQMLENYLKETELEYKCECGATKSRNRMSFVNLPRVLVLHLKRFRFTPMFQLKKVHDPVDLSRDLVVSSSEGGACYSLVSTISHLGHSAKSGHYVSDGMDLDVEQEDLSDRWFTYNDAVVTKTTGHSVCAKRRNSSYMLFYKRHD
ncbi:ubiquitin carboxyl-terminal hydrolase 37-like [Acanthopagrus latus]|uniref:ubiquitin carboxyl-terminal hydrolase 37-like n=1 Tax=Acanthopagrus latus TaxID=8177 RepID=UPI00187D072B|nr:ubiquitin carboxyl-terminal hydrolase 37-like [Acanthopagrus latus]